MSPGLQRAREPYRFRNALTGLGLGLLAFGIYSYSISAVKQDVFDDIDDEAKALARTGTISGAASLPSDSSPVSPRPPPVVLSKDEEKRIMESAFTAATGMGESPTTASQQEDGGTTTIPSSGSSQRPPRGLLQTLDKRLPWLLDPQNKTLVWGAPPIDDLGKMASSKRS
jgi:cytochrome c oxidase assembly factor 3